MSFNRSSSFVDQGLPVSQPQSIPPLPPPPRPSPMATGGHDFWATYHDQHPPPGFLTMFPAEIRPPQSTPTIPYDHIRQPLPPPTPTRGAELYPGLIHSRPPPPPPPPTIAQLQPPPPTATILQWPTPPLEPHPPLQPPPLSRMQLLPNYMTVLPPSPPLSLPSLQMGTSYYVCIYFLPIEFQGHLGPSLQPSQMGTGYYMPTEFLGHPGPSLQPSQMGTGYYMPTEFQGHPGPSLQPSGAGENGRPQVPLVPQENILGYENEENDDVEDNQENFESNQESDAMDVDDEEEQNSDQISESDSDEDEDEDENDNEGSFDQGEEDMDIQDAEQGQDQLNITVEDISVEDHQQGWQYQSTMELESATRIIYACSGQHCFARRTIILHHKGDNAGTFTIEVDDHEHD